MGSKIATEIEEETETVDHGVEKEILAEEEFIFHGEQVERETRVAILEDGGVSITQSVQGCYDELTLNEDVVGHLVQEVKDDA